MTILDYAKNAQISLWSPLGSLLQKMSQQLDQPPQWIFSKRFGTNQTVGINENIILNQAVNPSLGGGIDYDTETGIYTLTPGKTYHLRAHGRFSSFSDATDGVIVVDWVYNVNDVPIGPSITPNSMSTTGAFRPTTFTVSTTNDHPIAEAIIVPTSLSFSRVKLRTGAGTFGTAAVTAGEWMATVFEIR